MLIRQINELFIALEDKFGMGRSLTSYGSILTFYTNRGQGAIQITGNLDWWFHLDMDFSCNVELELDYDIPEPLMVIGSPGQMDGEQHPLFGTAVGAEDAVFCLNPNGLRGSLRHPAGKRMRAQLIIIRKGAYASNLLPALMHHPANDVEALIRQAGRHCRPYIVKSLAAFQLSGHGGQARSMQLNALVASLFTELIAQAERIGKPDTGPSVRFADQEAIDMAQQLIRENLREPPTIEELSRKVAVNRKKLQILFQEAVGMTIGDYVRACRMERAVELLETDMLISAIAHEVGYASPGRFSKAFAARYHMTPTEYRSRIAPPDTL
ncbi:MAG: AraC family transcriptional regulator [Clostridiales bacterium]|nr:AraC family transcriptional regulator [Clostridiales bacterium]